MKLNFEGQIFLFGLDCGIFAKKSDILTIILLYNGSLWSEIKKYYMVHDFRPIRNVGEAYL